MPPSLPSSAALEPAYADAALIRREVCSMFVPPRQISVVEASIGLKCGAALDEFSIETAPYMREPMNMMTTRDYEAEIYVGPARTGKTIGFIDCGAVYIARFDPADTMIVQMSESDARNYSIRRLDRIFGANEALQELLSVSPQDDNVFDKRMKNGMILTVGYPSAKQLASKDQRFMLITDYDRMPDSVERQGSVFDLARKRTQTYMSAGMTVVESSPARQITNADWRPLSPHDAPPVNGIFGLYNMGTKALWHWQCDHCHEYSEFSFSEGVRFPGWEELQADEDTMLLWPKGFDIEEAAEHAAYRCKLCEGAMPASAKYRLNNAATWLHEGQRIDSDGVILGARPRTTILSYWQKGPSAAFQSLSSLVRNYLRAVRLLAETGDEEALKATTNIDQGEAYMPVHVRRLRTAVNLKERAEQGADQSVVPDGVRFLIATIDVQVDSFQVLVMGHGPDSQMWPIDRFAIVGDELRGRRIQPHIYEEDWELLESLVIDRRYELADGTGDMGMKVTGIDTGGSDGVTQKAYSFWRAMRIARKTDRVAMLKGRDLRDDGKAAEPVIRTFPETKATKEVNLDGQVPLYQVLVNNFKSQLATLLDRKQAGPGYIHLPAWMADEHFDELTAEYRDEKGRWKKKPGRRNETWDLVVYQLALRWYLKVHLINWDAPPMYARPWAANTLVRRHDASAPDLSNMPAAVIQRGARRVISRGIANA